MRCQIRPFPIRSAGMGGVATAGASHSESLILATPVEPLPSRIASIYCSFQKISHRPSASVRSLFCHCDSCRRAHAAPLYQVVYLPESCFEITAGAHLLNAFARSPAHVVRSFCSVCGSRVCNRVTAKPSLGVGFFPNLLDESSQRALPEVTGGEEAHDNVVGLKLFTADRVTVLAFQVFKPTEHFLSHEVRASLDRSPSPPPPASCSKCLQHHSALSMPPLTIVTPGCAGLELSA